MHGQDKIDVVVIGAGIAGLSCASSLQAQGYSVVVLEKSRGLGGRVATRRIDGTQFDYGARYLDATGIHTRALLDAIHRDALNDNTIGNSSPSSENIPFVPWPQRKFLAHDDDRGYQLQPSSQGYVPKTGMTAIAKYLARPLNVIRQQRVQRLQPNAPTGWNLYVEGNPDIFIRAQAVILAIPAPQVMSLLTPLTSEGLSDDSLNAIQSVQFDPCITVTAGYSAGHSTGGLSPHPRLGDDWDAVSFPSHGDVSWVAMNSRKYPIPPPSSADPLADKQPDGAPLHQSDRDEHIVDEHIVLVVQSSAGFARQCIDDGDRQRVGDRLLAALNKQFQWPHVPPAWTHVHYWRYGFCTNPLPEPYILTQTPCLLGCTGDWCGGCQIEDALVSGDRLADALHFLLQGTNMRPCPDLT